MLDSMLYHKIAIDSLFSNKLYPCAPIVRLVFFFSLTTMDKLEFTDWSRVHQPFGYREIENIQ